MMKILRTLPFLMAFVGIPLHGISAEVTVGTYNLKECFNVPGITRDLKALHSEIDILAVQELIGEPCLRAIQEVGYPYVSKIELNPYGSGMEALAIFSKFPIQEAWEVKLNHSAPKARSALAARILVGGTTPLLFVNTDHETDFFKIRFRDRKKQLLSLKEFFDQYPHEPSVVLGDFNTSGTFLGLLGRHGPHWEANQTKLFFESIGFQTPEGIPAGFFTFQVSFLHLPLDHLYGKNVELGKWKKFSRRIGSDHFPIYTRIRF